MTLDTFGAAMEIMILILKEGEKKIPVAQGGVVTCPISQQGKWLRNIQGLNSPKYVPFPQHEQQQRPGHLLSRH